MIMIDKVVMQYLALALILYAPVLALISQVCLAVREIAINTRKDYEVNGDYRILFWIATVMTYLSFCMVLLAFVLFAKSC